MNKNDEELDKKLKEELSNKINPSPEFSEKIANRIEKEKTKRKEKFEQVKTTTNTRKKRLILLKIIALAIPVITPLTALKRKYPTLVLIRFCFA